MTTWNPAERAASAPTTIRTAYTYTLVNVFLPWCARHDIALIEQLTQEVLDQFTTDLLDTPSKRESNSRPTPSTTTSASFAS